MTWTGFCLSAKAIIMNLAYRRKDFLKNTLKFDLGFVMIEHRLSLIKMVKQQV